MFKCNILAVKKKNNVIKFKNARKGIGVNEEKKIIVIAVIIAANVLTTAMTFAVEHIFCHGEW